MIIVNDYKDFKVRCRYYIQKFAPVIFYPFFLKYFYKKDMGKELDLKNPLSLSEKLNYLKLYDTSPLKTMLSDKLLAKEYIKINLPELNVAKVYQEASNFEEIDFSKCPETFLIKTNHACKTGILINSKKELTQKKYRKYKNYYKKVMSINYAYWGGLRITV